MYFEPCASCAAVNFEHVHGGWPVKTTPMIFILEEEKNTQNLPRQRCD